jgi:hypothetical protein
MILNSPYVSGSLTVTGNIIASGSITLSGSVASASYANNATSASYAVNATTASYAVAATSASYAVNTTSASYAASSTSASFASNAQSASNAVAAATASFVALAQSASNAVTAQTASYADALTVAGTLTAQTLVVQTITSSVDFVTGSTRFGSLLGNTHQFTGSVSISGSIVTAGSITSYNALQTFSNVNDATPAQLVLSDTSNTRQLLIGYNSGSNYGSIQAIHQGVAYKNLVLNLSGGNVGIGISNPSQLLEIANTSGNAYAKLTADFGSAFIGMETADDSMRILTAQLTPIQFYTNNALRMTITNSGSIGVGTSSPKNIFQITNLTGSGVLPAIGAIGNGTSLYLTNNNTGYGMLMGMLPTGNGWIQVQRTDADATVYNLYLQPNGGSTVAGGSIVSTTGQFGSEKTVQINALNTSYLIIAAAASGIVSARDNTNGGSGLWLLDPNGNGGTATLVAQNWINGTYTVFYSGGNTYVQKTSGNIPVIFHYVIYGN